MQMFSLRLFSQYKFLVVFFFFFLNSVVGTATRSGGHSPRAPPLPQAVQHSKGSAQKRAANRSSSVDVYSRHEHGGPSGSSSSSRSRSEDRGKRQREPAHYGGPPAEVHNTGSRQGSGIFREQGIPPNQAPNMTYSVSSVWF